MVCCCWGLLELVEVLGILERGSSGALGTFGCFASLGSAVAPTAGKGPPANLLFRVPKKGP